MTVSDMLFDDSSVEVDNDDDGIPSLNNRPIHDDDETLEDTATYNDNYDRGSGDGDDTLTMMEVDYADDDQAAEASECENTLTDISAVVSSRLSCTSRFRREGSISRRTGVVSDDDEESQSNNLSMDTVHALFDENDECDDDDEVLEGQRKQQQRGAYHRYPSRKQQRGYNDHPESILTIITPKRKKKSRDPYRLKQIRYRGVQRFNSYSTASNFVKGLESSSRPRAMFGATSQGQHNGTTRTAPANQAVTRRHDVREEIVPFDEPLGFH
jgi:hypothetical protein